MATIMLVDDSRSIRELVSHTLKDAGHQVLQAENGAQGVEIASKSDLDLVLTDLNMPVMNGIECTRGIRALPRHESTPILLVTTESQLKKKNAAKEAGANGWVVKPIPPQRLMQLVTKVLAKYVHA